MMWDRVGWFLILDVPVLFPVAPGSASAGESCVIWLELAFRYGYDVGNLDGSALAILMFLRSRTQRNCWREARSHY
jgi:hypothetical protein